METMRPIYGGILIGGRSTRMGTPKHLLRIGEQTFLERIVAVLRPYTAELVLLGAGEVPQTCAAWPRLPDVPSAAGPLAGMLAAMRWQPAAAWIFVACDMPFLTADAVAWLLAQRAAERWAILPRLGRPVVEEPIEKQRRTEKRGSESDARAVEPLLALYEPEARRQLEALAQRGLYAPRHLADCDAVFTPSIPPMLASAWRNVNTPVDLKD